MIQGDMHDQPKVLEAIDIYREFQTPNSALPVLKGVSLDVFRGEMVAVTGESGVGKSTLLHILGGLDRPTGGDIRFGSESLMRKSEKKLAQFRTKKVGFVFQSHFLLDDFTALENIMIPMLLDGLTPLQAKVKGELLLEQVGLRDRSSHRPSALSGGEQQRVAVARALANDPEIVLADEPSGNLDTATGRKLHDLLFGLKADRSMTFLITTHNQELAEQADRWHVLADGKLTERVREV